MPHTSARSSHYDSGAETYDHFNERKSAVINGVLEGILKQYGVRSVLDLTCGTGSQVFWLLKCGFNVKGADINVKMLSIAKKKAIQQAVNPGFIEGDMRTLNVGQFDAVLTIFNAVGHLTKNDFEKAMHNINSNLKDGGLYIFDIFNLTYLLAEDNITSLTIDWQKKEGDTKTRLIQYSTIDQDGILSLIHI